MNSLYDEDVAAWAEQQVKLLRARQWALLDIEHIAEEIADMNISHRHQLAHRMAILMAHMLKWKYQPERRGKSWLNTIRTQRDAIAKLLRNMPSLRKSLEEAEWDEQVWRDAVEIAGREANLLDLPQDREWPFELVLKEGRGTVAERNSQGAFSMPVFNPTQFVDETTPVEGAAEPNQTLWITEAGGLTQFGGFVEVLQPGCRSSIKHWHSAEDEMVYVLDGQITVVEGTVETLMRAGDAATFKAGVAVGHYLENRSAAPTRCLVVGTRAPVDRIHYPDHDRVCLRDRSLPDDIWTDAAGQPADSPY